MNAADRLKRRYPCLATVVDISSKLVSCVAFKKYNNNLEPESWSFGRSDEEVVSHVLQANTVVENHYWRDETGWRLATSVVSKPKPVLPPLSVVVKQDLNTPPSLWATDLRKKTSKKLWDPNPQLARMDLGLVSIIHWKDPSGHVWTAGLVKPPDYVSGKRYPLVIQAHGFISDEFLSDGTFTTAFAARPLASVGIVVLQMKDSNTHEGSPKELSDQIRGYESAINYLSSMGLVDPQKVGIIGFSRTSWYTIGALVADPKLFAAASVTDGVDEGYMQHLIFGESNPSLRNEGKQIYGTMPFGRGLTNWVKKSPTFHLDRVQAPVLVTAIGPESILLEWTVYASLRMQEKPVDMLYIPGGQHELQKPLERLASQQGNVDWFRFWLQNYEDPNPAKATQYRRWEMLRKLPKLN
jgi:dipeptidyl aminopeptidase/acylaminoacyl peptidase